MISNKQKALIHIAKAQVGMTEEEYRAMLLGFGVSSSKDLTYKQFDGVMKRFGALGFQPKGKGSGDPASPLRGYAGAREKLMGKISAIRKEMGLTKRYVDAIAKNMFGVDLYGWCDAEQLRKIVAALTYHQRRKSSQASPL